MSVWSIELCRSWDRVGHLQDAAFEFHGVERFREIGEWSLAFPEASVAWSSYRDPNLPNYLPLDSSSGGATTPDAAALDVTGNIDVRWFGTLTDWDVADQTLFNKWTGAGSQQSWILRSTPTGVVVYISTTGADVLNTSAFPAPFADGAYGGIRFTRVQATGVTTVYFSIDDGANWVTAGSNVLSAGTALKNSSAALILGGQDGGFGNPPTGRLLRAELWNGIEGSGGSAVASPNFSNLEAGFSTLFGPFNDTQGNPWSMIGFAAQIKQDPLVTIKVRTPRDVDTVRLVENGVIRYAGFVQEPNSGTGGGERLLDPSGIRWKLSGPDMWDVLNTRVAFPDPTQADPSAWAATHDVNTGAASTVLAAYLNDNAGSSALADRQISGFSVIDGAVGASGTWSARLQPLYDLALRICADAEINIRFTANYAGQIIARIEAPRDLSETKVLSDQADLTSVRSKLRPALSTWVLVGGTGTGTGRTFRASDSGTTGINRRERFVDQSSLNQASEIAALALTTRRLDAAHWVVAGDVADSVTEGIGFGRSVYVGDKVSISSQGSRFVVPVSEIEWAITADRQIVRAALGEAIPDALRGLLRSVAVAERRLDSEVA